MTTDNEAHAEKPLNGFLVLLLIIPWAVVYIGFPAPSIHKLLRLDRLPQQLEIFSYLLHLIPVLGLPILVFWFLGRKERARAPMGGLEVIRTPAQTKRGRPVTVFRDFEALDLKEFTSPGLGLLLDAPPSWVEGGDGKVFQVIEPDTGTEISASAYENPGVTPEEWAGLRFKIVEQGMPYLQCVATSYRMDSYGWKGIASEYEGVFPGGAEKKRYLVLCVCTDSKTYSITITALLNVFEQHNLFYRWLLQTKLELGQRS